MDDRAFERQLLAAQKTILHAMLARSRSKEHAPDLVQDVLLKAWQSRHTYDESWPFKTWLNSIIFSVFVDWYRRRKNNSKEEPLLREHDIAIPPQQEWHLDALYALKVAESLPVRCAPLVPLLIEGYTHIEMAVELALPVGTVKSRMRTVKDHFAYELGEC